MTLNEVVTIGSSIITAIIGIGYRLIHVLLTQLDLLKSNKQDKSEFTLYQMNHNADHKDIAKILQEQYKMLYENLKSVNEELIKITSKMQK